MLALRARTGGNRVLLSMLTGGGLRGSGGQRQTGDMCLLVVLSRMVPEWPLIVAASRDEQYARPADPVMVLARAAARPLEAETGSLAGRGLRSANTASVAGLTNQPMQRYRRLSPLCRSAIPLS